MQNKTVTIIAAILCASLLLLSNGIQAKPSTKYKPLKILLPNQLNWQTSSTLPKNVSAALLAGNPTKPGIFAIRVRLPKHFRGEPHTHPHNAYIVVLSGMLHIDMGEKFNAASLKAVPPDGFLFIPAHTPHFEWTDRVTNVQVIGMGPWGTTLVNAKGKPHQQMKIMM